MTGFGSIEVEIEGTATSADIELVATIIRDSGLQPHVRATYGIGGDVVELAIWITVIRQATVALDTLTSESMKKLVERLWSERSKQSPGSNGIILLNEYGLEPDPDFSAILTPDLPESAFEDLRVLASTLKRGKVRYDFSLGGWIVDESQLRCHIKYLYDQFVFSSARSRRSRWKFWLR